MTTTNKIGAFLKKYFIVFEMLLVWACIWFVMRYVFIYFDDFGNVTLTYLDVYSPAGATGTNWSFDQLIEWEVCTYSNFGGRVIYSAFLCLLMRIDPVVYHLATSLLLTITFFFFYKIVCLFVDKKKALFAPLFMLCLFFCIPQAYKSECIYWASASCLYIWPFAPLSAALYLLFNFFKKDNSKSFTIVTLVLVPILCLFTSVSQEQFGVSILIVIVALFALYLKDYKKNKFFYILTITSFLVTLGGTLFILLSPGNMARADSGVNGDFMSLSFFEKVLLNIPLITKDINFTDYILARIFDIILISVSAYMIKNEKNVIKTALNIASIVIIVVTNVFFHFSKSIPFVVAALMVANQIYIITNFCLIKKQYCLLSLAAGMYVIAYSLTLSPVAELRPLVPFMMLLILFVTIGLFASYEKISVCLLQNSSNSKLSIAKKIFIVGFAALGIVGSGTMITEHNGYKTNYYINQLNMQNIKAACKDNQDHVYCFMNQEPHKSTQPYDLPSYTDRINKWIKTYLSVDQSLNIIWIDSYGLLNKKQYPSTNNFASTSHISGIYPYDTGVDGWWTNRISSFMIDDVEGINFYYHFGFENDMMVFVNGKYYTNFHFYGNGLYNFVFDDGVLNNKNNHILFVLTYSQAPTDWDARELGVVIKNVY